ncbi:carbohydrate-binding module family 1 protein [Piromyces sp. E2]|nr:carbohydrate-binding module family 1 protein [Piromyces sp. E2]|eukprot:OUM58344.1 carbohydrate-binding module family 1 protein [Piromyces sp. E2]
MTSDYSYRSYYKCDIYTHASNEPTPTVKIIPTSYCKPTETENTTHLIHKYLDDYGEKITNGLLTTVSWTELYSLEPVKVTQCKPPSKTTDIPLTSTIEIPSPSTSDVPTPTTLPTKCVPVIVTVTEKEKITVTEKETVTITVEDNGAEPVDDTKCAPKWAQCGGQDYNGPTCCQSGSTCHEYNKYYSQCM